MDHLIARGLTCITVLDVSRAALDRAKARLGPNGSVPTWLHADVTAEWRTPPVDIWHDRAVFHFLTRANDRARYLTHLRAGVKPGGAVLIATFALDGPSKCSGLPVVRYSPESLQAELGAPFILAKTASEQHRTPSGGIQSFSYAFFRVASAGSGAIA